MIIVFVLYTDHRLHLDDVLRYFLEILESLQIVNPLENDDIDNASMFTT